MSKSIAIVDTPSACVECQFHRCNFSHPWWAKENPNTKGIYCSLDIQKGINVLPYEDIKFKPEWCPLKPYKG